MTERKIQWKKMWEKQAKTGRDCSIKAEAMIEHRVRKKGKEVNVNRKWRKEEEVKGRTRERKEKAITVCVCVQLVCLWGLKSRTS